MFCLMYFCVPQVCLVPLQAERGYCIPSKLELQMIVSCHVSAGNQTGSSARATVLLTFETVLQPHVQQDWRDWFPHPRPAWGPICTLPGLFLSGSLWDPEGLHSFLYISHSTWSRLIWCKYTYWHWILSKSLSQNSSVQVYSPCFLVKREGKVLPATEERLYCQTGLAHTVISSSIISWEFLSCLNKIICVDMDITISKGVAQTCPKFLFSSITMHFELDWIGFS